VPRLSDDIAQRAPVVLLDLRTQLHHHLMQVGEPVDEMRPLLGRLGEIGSDLARSRP
jgi:hypothetical protein